MPEKTTTNPTLRDYIAALAPRGTVPDEDAIGAHLSKLYPRKRRIEANGLFGRVRALNEAVVAAGGNVNITRGWINQSIRWTQTNKAVDQKFAHYEIDKEAAAAMDALLKLLEALPADVMERDPTSNPPSPFSGVFGGKPGAPPSPSPFGSGTKPSMPPTSPSPFGARPGAPSTPPSPFGARPGAPPTPPQPSPFAPKPLSPFAKPVPPPPGTPTPTPTRPSGLFGSRPSTPPPPPDPTPSYVIACLEALVTEPDVSTLPDWLEALSAATGDTTLSADTTEAKAIVWPSDLKGLLESLNNAPNAEATRELLLRIGALNDWHALDYFYNMLRNGEASTDLIGVFGGLGGEIAAAGLLSLMPIAAEQRAEWLAAMAHIVQSADTSHFFTDSTRTLLQRIAVAENNPDLPFCEPALHLVASLGCPEAIEILFRFLGTEDEAQRRTALGILIQIDPGVRTMDVLTAWMNTPPKPPTPFLPPMRTITRVCIPFETLQMFAEGAEEGLAVCATELVSYLDDPRVIPLLTQQLTWPADSIRMMALRHLKRLDARDALDAVAALLDTQSVIVRAQAADLLVDWGDVRGVPIVLAESTPDDVSSLEKFVKRLDPLNQPAFDVWLLNFIEQLGDSTEPKKRQGMGETLNVLIKNESRNVRPLVEKLLASPISEWRRAAVEVLPAIKADWAATILRQMCLDPDPRLSYLSATTCADQKLGESLIGDAHEVQRLIGLRILFNAKCVGPLIDSLADRSTIVRGAAIIALGELRAPEAIEPLRRLIDDDDRLDGYGQNLAVLAWRSLARLGAFKENTATMTA